MNLAEEIGSFLKSLSEEEAVAFFNRKPSTIKVWMKSGNYPMEAIQRYMDHLAQDAPKPEEPVTATQEPGEFTTVEEAIIEQGQIQKLFEAVNILHGRLTEVEQYLMQYGSTLGQPQQQQGIGIVPQKNVIPARPDKAWYDVDPSEMGFNSFVNPGATVATKGSFSTPAPQAGITHARVPTVAQTNAPSSLWLGNTPKRF